LDEVQAGGSQGSDVLLKEELQGRRAGLVRSGVDETDAVAQA
jgi:hypothetical protein